MKLMTKLLMGFLGVALIVLVAGVIGIFSATTIGKNADLIGFGRSEQKRLRTQPVLPLI